MKKIYLFLLVIFGYTAFAQQKGISYQAVIINPNSVAAPGYNGSSIPLANKSICLSFQIVNSANQVEYQESQSITTDGYGMINVIIGTGTSGTGLVTNLDGVNWNQGNKKLVVGVNTDGVCSNYTEISNQVLNYTSYSFYALNADIKDGYVTTAKLADGAVTDAKVATGINPAKVGLGNVDNTADLNKPMSTATKIYVDSQFTSSTIVDADTATKGKIKLAGDLAGTADLPTVPGLALKANSTYVTTSLALKEDVSNKSNATLGTSTTLYPTQNAVKTYVDTAITGATIVDADTATKGKIKLAGDLAGTADLPTVPGLALKADIASPSFTGTVIAPIYASTPQLLTTGTTISWNPDNGLNASVTLDQNSTLSFTATPTAGSYGTLVVTQDATGGRTITLPSTANKVLGSTSTTTIALSTAANAKDILNFYYDGTNCYWNIGQGYGTAAATNTNLATSVSGTLPVANGGTGTTTLTGLVKGNGTGVMTVATAGTDYLAPTGSAASLTNFPTLNQNTTGTAANVTGTVSVANGGTGATTATTALANLTGTQAANKVLAGPATNLLLLGNYDGTSLTGWTATGGASLDTGTFKVTGGNQSMYRDLGQNFKNKTVQFDVKITAGNTGFTIGAAADGSGGLGVTLRAGTSNSNGLRSTTNWFYTNAGGDTFTFTAGTWYTIKIVTDNGSVAGTSWYINGVLAGNSGGYFIDNGTYFGIASDNATANFDNISISGVSNATDATPTFRTLVAADIPTLNQNTTGTAANVTGTVSVTNGGTGVTSLTGLVKGNGTGAMTSATAGTDYQAPITLTTSGTGVATLSGNTLNIPPVSIGDLKFVTNLNNIGVGGTTTLANATGGDNVAMGRNALGSYYTGGITGGMNIGIGTDAGDYNSSGSRNIYVGAQAGITNQTGSDNTFIGYNTASSIVRSTRNSISNSTAIGANAVVTTSNKIQLGDTNITNVATSGTVTAGTVTYPNAHNSTAGQVLTVNAAGTASWETPASSSGTAHYVGEVYGGGIVFYITTGGFHGLIAETINSSGMSPAELLDLASDPNQHNTNNGGKLYTDWRVPTYTELKLLYAARNTVGLNLGTSTYQSSTLYYNFVYKALNFSNNTQDNVNGDWNPRITRYIRSF